METPPDETRYGMKHFYLLLSPFDCVNPNTEAGR